MVVVLALVMGLAFYPRTCLRVVRRTLYLVVGGTYRVRARLCGHEISLPRWAMRFVDSYAEGMTTDGDVFLASRRGTNGQKTYYYTVY